MGQKANLNGFHLSILKDWSSIWYLSFIEYSKILHEDFLFYKFLRSLNIYKCKDKKKYITLRNRKKKKTFRNKKRKTKIFNIVKIRVCRISNNIIIELYISFRLSLKRNKRKLVFIRRWKEWKKKMFYKVTSDIALKTKMFFFNIKNVYIVSNKISLLKFNEEVNFIARKIAILIENRVKFRSRLIKKVIKKTKKLSLGIFVSCSGRLNGVDIARSDFISYGAIPFQSLNKRISYGCAIANTAKGLQSIKVCIYK